MIELQILFICIFLTLAVRGFFYRNRPQAGGKFGWVRTLYPPPAVPDGFSRVYGRLLTLFVATDASHFSTLQDFLRNGTVRKAALFRFYCVAGCKTEIEIPDQTADYERIDAVEALALLRELPDPRLARRLHLSDERSFLDPWLRKTQGEECFNLGNATNFSLVVLYKPDRRLGQYLGITLLHEWLHLVAFASTIQIWHFKRADLAEPLPSPAFKPMNFGDRNTDAYEAWCNLGEQLLGYDDSAARQAALAFPVHAMILWRCVERILRRTPQKFRSTRFDELMERGKFMRTEVEPRSREKRTKQVS